MDVCGPLIETPAGNKYMLVICDHFTRFTQVFPMPDQTAATIAKNIVYGWIRYFGEPLQIHHDQGTNFESDLMKQLCDVYGIEQRRTSPYHPQADGMVERFNKTIMNLIHGASEKKDDWDEVGVLITSAYNSTVHGSTGFTRIT